MVRPSAIASILADDVAASQAAAHASPSYTLYLLNPEPHGVYAYTYDAEWVGMQRRAGVQPCQRQEPPASCSPPCSAVTHLPCRSRAAHRCGACTAALVNPLPRPCRTRRHQSCPGAVHLDTRLRMGFVDLGANITFLGPGPGGRGQVRGAFTSPGSAV